MFKTMTDGVLSIALTGHRPDKLAGYNLNNPFYGRLHERLMKIIERALDNYPLVECHSGMALGADTVWAEVIVECQEKYVATVFDLLQISQMRINHLVGSIRLTETVGENLLVEQTKYVNMLTIMLVKAMHIF